MLAGVVAALVGFTSSFAVVLAGLRAVGASVPEAASGLLALCVVMGVLGIALSATTRMPVSVVWSTPGAALLVTAGRAHYGYGAAVGAFLLAGLLLVATGLCRPLGRLVAAIPPEIGSAVLAGVLLPLCLSPVEAAVRLPRDVIPVVASWLVLERIAPRLAVPGAALAAGIAVAATTPLGAAVRHAGPPALRWTSPVLDPAALIGIGLPLFLVTMAAQNVPGLTVLRSFGYTPEPGPLLAATGGATAAVAGFGGHSLNLAAITAALCAGPSAHREPTRRWIAAAAAGVAYVGLGLGAGLVTAVAARAPALLVESVAGLGLLGALGSALGALAGPGPGREAAVVAFAVTASGISPAGIGSPLWGLAAGGVLALLSRRREARCGTDVGTHRTLANVPGAAVIPQSSCSAQASASTPSTSRGPGREK